MMRIPSFLLTQTAAVSPYLGDTAYGERYGNAVDVNCHIEHRNRVVTDRDGKEVVSSAKLYAAPDAPVHAEDRVTWLGSTYRVINAAPFPGPSGAIHHIEAELTSWRG